MWARGKVKSVWRQRALLVAWAGLPVTILLHVWLRYYAGHTDSVGAQLAFLTPVILATAFTASAAWLAPARTRAKVVWTLTALACALLFVSETYFSWSHVSGESSAFRDAFFDVLNAMAFVVVLVMLAVAAGVDRIGWQRTLRVVFDGIALMALGCVTLVEFWLRNNPAILNQPLALRMSGYAIVGIAVLMVDVYVYFTLPVFMRRKPWTALLQLGIAVFSVTIMIWPWLSLSTDVVGDSVLVIASNSVLFMIAYYLVFMAGLSRVRNSSEPWARVMSQPPAALGAWPGVAISVSVLASVILLGVVGFSAPEGSERQALYLSALVVASGAMVARTALSSFESNSLRSRGRSDQLTGASNMRGLIPRIARDMGLAVRYGRRFAVILLDYRTADEATRACGGDLDEAVVLAAASRLIASFPAPAEVFRLGGDVFGVVLPVRDRTGARLQAQAALDSVGTATGCDGEPLRPAVGFAVGPDDSTDAPELLSHAHVALAWARQYGKGRAAAYDSRVGVALGVDRDAVVSSSEGDPIGADVARALIAASDARDLAMYHHSRGVAALACLLADDLDDREIDMERLRLAAILHDVGKIGLPQARRSARASNSPEALVAREHSELGERMLRASRLDDIAPWVRSHHEQWDGGGYPDGLRGASIPLEARIISVADAYERLTSTYPGGGALSKAAALQEIDQGIATRFDPVVAERFIRIVGLTDAVVLSGEWALE